MLALTLMVELDRRSVVVLEIFFASAKKKNAAFQAAIEGTRRNRHGSYGRPCPARGVSARRIRPAIVGRFMSQFGFTSSSRLRFADRVVYAEPMLAARHDPSASTRRRKRTQPGNLDSPEGQKRSRWLIQGQVRPGAIERVRFYRPSIAPTLDAQVVYASSLGDVCVGPGEPQHRAAFHVVGKTSAG